MATGMAIMGFGGGALVGSPLADVLMRHFGGPTSVGVWQTLLVLSVIYLVFMLGGALGFRVPPSDWRPDGWTPPKTSDGLISTFSVHLKDAHKTPQFWLIWVVLLLNVSASIGIIGVASPMLQEIFAGRLFGHPEIGFAQFDSAQKAAAATTGAGFVGLLSLFNIGGRFGWASFSDLLGRKLTFTVMLALGAVLFGVVATWSATGAIMAVFVLSFCITTSMYGGGFSTVPAYLADIFGTQFVGAIHGRLLTAWSTAGVLGPFIVTTIRDRAIAAHAPRAEIYPHIYLILAGLLVVGLIANLMVRPVAERWHMAPVATGATSEEPAADVAKASGIDRGRLDLPTTLAWLVVVIPLVWGVWVTVAKAIVLFQ
jgi:MFS family permease